MSYNYGMNTIPGWRRMARSPLVTFGLAALGLMAMVGIPAWHFYSLNTEWYSVDQDYGKIAIAFYPQTRYTDLDKFATYRIECQVRECRVPAVLIDENGRMAKVWSTGTNGEAVGISPDGTHAIIMGMKKFHLFDGRTFSTHHTSESVDGSVLARINNEGRYIILSEYFSEDENGIPVRGIHALDQNDSEGLFYQGMHGKALMCDGKIQFLEGEYLAPEHDPLTTWYYDADRQNFDRGEVNSQLRNIALDSYSCAEDGAGSAYLVGSYDTNELTDEVPEGQGNLESSRVQLFKKTIGKEAEQLSSNYLIKSDDSISVGGRFYATDHELWVVNNYGKMMHYNFDQSSAAVVWTVDFPGRRGGEDSYGYNVSCFERYCFLFDELKQGYLIGQVYDRKTGKKLLEKELKSLNAIYKRTSLNTVVIRDQDTAYNWLAQQPDLTR